MSYSLAATDYKLSVKKKKKDGHSHQARSSCPASRFAIFSAQNFYTRGSRSNYVASDPELRPTALRRLPRVFTFGVRWTIPGKNTKRVLMNNFEGDDIARFPGGRLSHPLIRAVRREGMVQGKNKSMFDIVKMIKEAAQIKPPPVYTRETNREGRAANTNKCPTRPRPALPTNRRSPA